MTIAVHIVNTPKNDAQQAYEAAWRRIDELGVRHPAGRKSHTAWLVGDVLNVLDVWDSQGHADAFMETLGPILTEFDMHVAGQPEVGEVLLVVQPEHGDSHVGVT